MPKVRVYNENTFPYDDEFKGEKIHIPAKGYIEMDYYDAFEFKGAFKSPKRDGDGQPLPSSFKMIRIDETAQAPEVLSKEHACIACKYKAGTAAALEAHVKEAHSEQTVVDEEAEREIKARRKAKERGDDAQGTLRTGT